MSDMRLIDAEELKATIVQNYRREFFGSILWNILDDMPTIDAVPVVHGRWSEEDTERYVCTVCGKWFFIDSGDGDMNYCPHCGAKMDGGAEG